MPHIQAPVSRAPDDPSKPPAPGPGQGVPPAFVLPFFLTVLACLLAGLATLALAIPPSDVAPFFPAAGVGLASVLVYGRGMMPAVLLGSLGVGALQHLSGQSPHMQTPHALSLLVTFAVCSSFQAGVGAFLVRRFVPLPLILEESRDIFAFVGAVALGCLASSVPSNLAIWAAGPVPTPSLLLGTAMWWLGDLLGILVAVPICLTFIGRPREIWAARRLSVGVTLSFVTLMLGAAIQQVSLWHRDRSNGAFDRDAASASRLLIAQLDEPLQALRAIHSVFVASKDVNQAEFQAATADWLTSGRLLAIGWGQWVRHDEVKAFEAQVRVADALPGFRVFDRRADASSFGTTGDSVPIRFIEPRLAVNIPVLGLNVLSVPQLRAAVLAAQSTSAPVASDALPLMTVQGPAIIIYQAVPRRPSPGVAAASFNPAAPTLGFVFTAIRLEQQIQAVKNHIPSYLGVCIIDNSRGSAPLRIAGAPDCETAPPNLRRSQPLAFTGRDWEIRVFAGPGSLPGAGYADVWLFALVGLFSTSTLGGFLLMLTGRTRRIETAVHERTAALRAEVQEREAAQDELNDSEQRFRNILNNVPIGVIYTDLEGNVEQCNPRFCELLGYREEELVILNSRDYTYPEDLAQDIELTDKLLRGEIPMVRRHTRFVTADGTVLWVQATATLLRDASGVARRIVGVVENVTEHMKLEEAERAREAAEASNRAKSDFLSRMSHELRTPLNAMLGFAQLLELDPRHPLSPTQKPWVAQIQRAGWHLLEMINDVLDLSRIESGNLRLQTETLNLVELVDATRSMVLADAEQRGIAITVELGVGARSVLGDATRVKQILTNLLSNAVKYNVDSGRVQVVARTVGDDSVAISVNDTGLGMTAEQLGQLFQPFNRLGLERSTLQGTGIGLVISQRLAELMGGSLRARSVAGEGSSFVLRLPSVAEPDTVRSEFDMLRKTTADYHTRIVHYVEDNETNVEVMRGILAQRPQVALEVSVTGLDALAAIRARRPDLILLDMHLPDIDGMELLRYFKADPQLAPVPVVIVSADALAQQIEAATAVGCARYLTKPVNVSALLRVVDELLEEMDTHFG